MFTCVSGGSLAGDRDAVSSHVADDAPYLCNGFSITQPLS